MNLLQSVVLGVVEGLTEFLPVSSTGHLTIAEKLLGLRVDDPEVTGFTAVIQVGAIVAVLVYFARDIVAIVAGWGRGLVSAPARRTFEYRFGWLVIVGSIPIGVVGFAARHVIAGPLRSLWVVAAALVAWSVVMVYAEWRAARRRGTPVRTGDAARSQRAEVAVQRVEADLTVRDALVIGLVQCVALVPGVSRSGATISAGLLRGLNRVAATRVSFFLGIPALVAAGIFELPSALGGNGDVGLAALAVGTLVSFVVAYASVAWLLRFVAHHTISAFVPYRVLVGVALAVALATGALSST